MRMRASCWLIQLPARSEEHTSELQSRLHLVCRLLLEKKKTNKPLLVSPTGEAPDYFHQIISSAPNRTLPQAARRLPTSPLFSSSILTVPSTPHPLHSA